MPCTPARLTAGVRLQVPHTMAKAIDKINWHDGNLVGISTDISAKGKCTVKVMANVYPSEQSPERIPLKIQCTAVSRVTSSIDVTELKNNQWAGNISHGYLKDKVLWIYFTDGFIEVRAEKFTLSK